MTQKNNGASLFVECLVQQKVEYIFAIPGAKIDALFDALKDSPIKLILCRHEQNACFQAQSYGRLTGKPGVVLVTSGPGVTNLITGLLTATTEGDPIVAIGGNVPRSMKLKKSHQACDNIKLTEAATKLSQEVLMAENIPEIIQNSFRTALEPRQGAVFISLPQDVALEQTQIKPSFLTPPCQQGPALDEVIHEAYRLIQAASCPMILLGQGATLPINTSSIREFIDKTRLPCVSTFQAAGVLPKELLDCFVGRIGLFKNQPGDELIKQSDLIIAIGFNTVEYDPEIWNSDGGRKIVHVDYLKADIHRTYTPNVELLGNIEETIKKLTWLVKTRPHTKHALVEKLRSEITAIVQKGKLYDTMPVHPLRFIAELKDVVDEDYIVTCDVGSHYMWMARYFYIYEPHQLLFSNGQQTLGIALPWAMAAKLVNPQKHVISISGDGGFLFSAQELETAVRLKLSFVHFVWVDGTYNMVQEQQLLKYHRDSCVHFGKIDLVKYAESFGAKGFKIHHPDDIKKVLKEALSIKGPVLVEVPIDYSDNLKLFLTAHDVDI